MDKKINFVLEFTYLMIVNELGETISFTKFKEENFEKAKVDIRHLDRLTENLYDYQNSAQCIMSGYTIGSLFKEYDGATLPEVINNKDYHMSSSYVEGGGVRYFKHNDSYFEYKFYGGSVDYECVSPSEIFDSLKEVKKVTKEVVVFE